MNKKRLLFKKINLKSILLVFCFFLFTSSAMASHFRHGTISWRVVSGNTIEFKISQAWKNGCNIGVGQTCYGDRLYFGDGQNSYFNVVATAVNSSENWYYGEATITHTYANIGNFVTYFSSCCKIGQLSNNANAGWRNETIVNVGSGNESPVTTMAPIINMQTGTTAATFQVPASDPDGDTLTYRLATYAEILGGQPSGISIDSNTGVITFNTNGRPVNGLWNAAIVVEDGQTKVINDFIIKIVQQSNPPIFDYTVTPANGQVYQISPGVPVNFSVKADDTDPGAIVSLQSIGVPTGASVTLSNQNTSSITGAFSWIPTASNLGTNVINFLAQDNVGAQVSTSVTILVSLKPQFDVPPTPAEGVHNVYNPGDVISYSIQASDPDPLDVVRFTDIKGKDMMGMPIALYNNASFSNLNGVAANPTNGTFTWNTQASDWGHKHLFIYATDSYGDVTKHEVSQLINTPPVFASAPIITADVGTPYSYTINVSDADSTYGDEITIIGTSIPAWLTITDNGNGTATLSGTPTVADVGTASINIQAEDKHHHQDPRGIINQTFNITVNNCAVTALAKDFTITLDANGTALITTNDINNNSTASCGIASISLDKTNFDCNNVGVNTVTLTVTDSNNNSTTSTAIVTVTDEIAPVITLNGDATITHNAFTAYTDAGATADDNCGTLNAIVGGDTVDVNTVGSYVITYDAEDASGNNATQVTRTVTVSDTTAPTAIAQDITVQLDANGNATIIASDIDNGSSDDSGNVTLSLDKTTFNCSDLVGGTALQMAYSSQTNQGWQNWQGELGLDFNLTSNLTINTLGAFDHNSDGINGGINGGVRVAIFDRNTQVIIPGLDVIISGSGDPLVDNYRVRSIAPVILNPGQYSVVAKGYGSAELNGNQTIIGTTDDANGIIQFVGGGRNIGADFTNDIRFPTGIDLGPANRYMAGNFGHGGVGSNSVTLTATDNNGNVSTATATVTVEDNIAPTITLNGDATITHNAFTAYTDAGAIADDNCGTLNAIVGGDTVDVNTVGSYVITYDAEDASGNNATQVTRTVNVSDTTAPTAIAQDITVQLDANGNATIIASDIDNGSSDDSGNVTLSISDGIFDCDDVSGSITNYALNFDGQNDWIDATGNGGAKATASSLGLPVQAITLEAYVNVSSFGNWKSIISFIQDNGSFERGWDIETRANGRFAFTLNSVGGGGALTYMETINQFNTNQWYHIAGSYDGTTMKIYVDGVLENTSTAENGDIWYADSWLSLGMFKDDNETYPLASGLDEVRIWNYAKTQAEIQATMSVGLVGSETGLVAYYAFEDGPGGNVVADLSGNEHNGTLNQMDPATDWIAGVPALDLNGQVEVILTVIDANGNSSSTTANVTVEDNIDPTVNLNGAAAITHNAFTAYTDAGAIADDNCGTLNAIVGGDTVDVNTVGTYVITYDAEDASGNNATQVTRTVNVLDTTSPIAIAQDITVQLEANGNATITPEQINNGSSDDSGNVTLSLDTTTFDCDDVGGITSNNYSIDFDGVNDWIDATGNGGQKASAASLGLPVSEITLEVYVNVKTFGIWKSMVGFLQDNGSFERGWDLETRNDNRFGFALNSVGGGGGLTYMETTNQFNLDQWYHIAATYDGTSMKIYVDGVLENTSMAENGDILYADSWLALGMYKDDNEANSLVSGMDEVRIFDYAKTQAEIQVTMSSTLSGTETGLVAYYPFEDGPGSSTVTDLSGNGHNGILTNMDPATDWYTGSTASGSGSGTTRNQVTLTVTDPSGNESTATANVTVEDNVNPIAIAQKVVVQLGSDGNGTTTAALVNNGSNDACGIASLVLSKTDFTCSDIGTNPNTVTLTVTDNNGNISTIDATVTVEDNVNPIAIAQNVVVQLDSDGNGTTTAALVNNGSNDACGIASLVLSKTAFTCSDIGTNPNTVTLTVTDNNGNISTIDATVTVEDNVNPIAIAQNVVIQLDAFGNGSTTAALVNDGSNDACGVTLALSQLNFDCTHVGDNTVTLTVTDTNMNISTIDAIVTVEDNVAPIAVAQNVVVQLDSDGNGSTTAALVDAGSNDACGIASLALSKTDFTCTHIGDNTVTLTVTDNNGNISTIGATVTVEDNVAPIALVQNVVIQLDASGNGSTTAALVDAGSNDACGIASLALSKTDFTCTHIGDNTVTLTVTDNNGNISTIDAIVTVEDNVAPIALAKNVVVQLDASGNGSTTAALVDDGSNDACGVTLALSQLNFDCTHIGDNTVTLTVTDNNGNISTIGAIVTVEDNVNPIAVAQNVVVQLDAFGNGSTTAALVDAGSNDACGIASLALSKTDFTCTHIGDNTVTLTVTDNNGNISTIDATVTVEDNVDPIAVAQNVVIQLDASGNAATTAALVDDGSNDACGVTLALSQLNFDCTHIGDNTVTLTVTDTNMNISTIDAIVTVEDNIAPIAVAQDFTITLDEFGSATITANDIDSVSTDNCTYTPSIDIDTFDCTNIGIVNTVTLTVTDSAGNKDSTTANVTILEHFKETLDLRSLTSFEAFTGTGAIANAGTLSGDVGTNAGALTGFTGSSFNGNTYLNNALTEQADIDLLKVYIHLNNVFETHPGTHAPAFGNGETLTPGVYSIGGAGSVAGTLTLDGQGDPNAVFIMKFKGAFTAGAATNIVLINSADAANVYWVAQGALSVGAASTIKGTLLAYPGAITLGVDSSIEGRLLSSVGAITIAAGGVATIPGGKMNIPINPVISYTPAPAVDVLGSLENFSLFTSNGAVANASTSGILGDVGADIGAITGFATSAHIGSFYNADAVTAQAKIDLDNAYSQLMMIPTTVSSHAPAFGSGETLQAGVYATPGAGSLAGTITLDGAGDDNAIFIFKFNGAFSAGAQSRVILSNGTHQSNVFWISEGATSIGSFSTIKGTVIANDGAATIGAGGNLEGRLLSTGGAIGFSTGVVYTVVHDVECGYEIELKGSYVNAEVTSIESLEQVLVVYPNPSRGIFNIKLSTLNVQTDIYLFDIVGKLIERKSISKENNSGNLISIGNNDLPSGIYLVRIMTNRGVETKKLVVDSR